MGNSKPKKPETGAKPSEPSAIKNASYKGHKAGRAKKRSISCTIAKASILPGRAVAK